MSKIIRVVENGVEKEPTTKTINKVKLDHQIDSNELEKIIKQ